MKENKIETVVISGSTLNDLIIKKKEDIFKEIEKAAKGKNHISITDIRRIKERCLSK